MAAATRNSSDARCDLPCGCGARCPQPAGHAGHLWAESSRLIHSHPHVPVSRAASRSDRWWLPVTIAAALISLALAVVSVATFGS
jgi:hypothetical protein